MGNRVMRHVGQEGVIVRSSRIQGTELTHLYGDHLKENKIFIISDKYVQRDERLKGKEGYLLISMTREGHRLRGRSMVELIRPLLSHGIQERLILT